MLTAQFFFHLGIQFRHLQEDEGTVANVRLWMGGSWETRPALCWERESGFYFWCGFAGMTYHSLWTWIDLLRLGGEKNDLECLYAAVENLVHLPDEADRRLEELLELFREEWNEPAGPSRYWLGVWQEEMDRLLHFRDGYLSEICTLV